MNKLSALAIVLTLSCGAILPKSADAYTEITFGPNIANGQCKCYSLHDGLTPTAAQTPSFLAISNCNVSTGGFGSVTIPETMGPMGTVGPPSNIVASLPAPPAGTRRVLLCGNPPGSTPLFDFGTSTVYASYADVPCSSNVSGQQVPAGAQPPWMAQFVGTSGSFPVCNP